MIWGLMARCLFVGGLAALLVGTSHPAGADVEREYVEGVVAVVDNPCTPEIEALLVEGVRITTTRIFTNPDGSTHMTIRSRFSGTITEEVDGEIVVYNVKGQDNDTVYDGIGAPVITTFVHHLNAITPGPNPNFTVHENVALIVSATGETATQHFSFIAECKGNH